MLKVSMTLLIYVKGILEYHKTIIDKLHTATMGMGLGIYKQQIR